MTHRRTLESVEEILRGFAPVEPSAGADERILDAAGGPGRVARRRPLAVLAGLSTLAAAACFAAYLATRPSASPAPPSTDVPSVAVLEEEVVLSVLADYRSRLDDIAEMLTLVPSHNETDRERIRSKLNECLDRLTRLESRVRRKAGSSWLPGTNRKEVRV